MAKKKDENPFTPDPATVVKPADLVAENLPPAKTAEISPADTGGNSDGIKLASEPEKGPAENPPPNNPAENPPPVATPPSAPENPPAATTVTAAQLVSEEIPPSAPPIGNPPGQPGQKKVRGRPSIPHPECKKCGRKHPAGICPTKDGVSQINIANGPQPSAGGEDWRETDAIPEKPPVNYRQLAEVTFDLTTNTAAVLIGPEWRAENQTEREMVVVPLEAYYRAQEMKDIPPGVVLAFACAGYGAARLRHSNTRNKLQMAWLWIKSKMPGKRRQFVPSVLKKDENPFAEKN